MARINYYDLEVAIANQIDNDTGVSAKVVVEEEIEMGREAVVHISLTSREEPADRQSISAGTRIRALCKFSVQCFVFGFDLPAAFNARDELIANVEQALMTDHTFGNFQGVNTSWLRGGDFDSAKQDKGFVVGGEIELVVDVTGVA